MSKGLLLVLLGPSGSGKGTVLREVLSHSPNTFLSVSATTRKPREGEEEGKQYYFMTEEHFQELVEEDGFLEYACYVNHCYGTPKKPVLERIEQGQNVVLEIEVQGARQIKELYPEAVFLFILPPSLAILRDRLVKRNTEEPEVVMQRLKTAYSEIPFANECDYIVMNHEVEEAANEICAIITAEHARQKRRNDMVEQILKETITID